MELLKEKKVLNIALVGLGRIAKKHIEAINEIDGLKLVATSDIDHLKRVDGILCYNDFHTMLKNEDVDIVSILTPSGMHYAQAIEIIKYKKHLIIEKPMALRYDEALHILDMAQKYGVRVFTVKQNRFNLPIKKLKEAIDSKKFGKIVLGAVRVRWCRTQKYYDMDDWRGTWRYDGGVLANQAIHHIDLLEWIIGEVESVYAISSTSLVNIEVEDTAVALIEFKNGAKGVIEATTATRPRDIEGSLSVLGENGSVEIGGFAVNKIAHWEFKDENIDKEKFSQNPPNVYGFGHKEFYADVVNSILNDTPALTEGAEGARSIRLMNALYESIASGKKIYLDNFKIDKASIGK